LPRLFTLLEDKSACISFGELCWRRAVLSLKHIPPGICAKSFERQRMTHPELLRLRESIDNIDAALIHLLAERFKCTQAVGEYKAAHNLPPADPSREAAQIARLRKLAEDAKLDPDFAEKFLNFIVKEVIRHHEAIAKSRT
jgi:chorismate mutase